MGGNSQKVQRISTLPAATGRCEGVGQKKNAFRTVARMQNRYRLHLRRGVPALVEYIHRNALLQLHTSRTENRAESFGYASMVANHLADVFRMNSQFEDSHRRSSTERTFTSSGWSTSVFAIASSNSPGRSNGECMDVFRCAR